MSFGSDTPTLDPSTGNGTRDLFARTTPVVFPNGPCVSLLFSLNADISVGGIVTMQILEATTGRPIPPFTHEGNVGFTGNRLAEVATWLGNNDTAHTDLQPLARAGFAVKLEFKITPPARLFSWEFVCKQQ